MKKFLFGAVVLVAGALVACNQQQTEKTAEIVIERQGVFASGGRVTEPIPGEYDAAQNWLNAERKGTTTHVDHANTFYETADLVADWLSSKGVKYNINDSFVAFMGIIC